MTVRLKENEEFFIRMSDKNALLWIDNLIQNSIKYANERTQPYIKEMEHLHEAFQNPLRLSDLAVPSVAPAQKETKPPTTGSKPPVKKRKTKKRVSTGPSKEDLNNPLICVEHPKYTGLSQRPRIDCERCWGVYKLLHPLEYPLKRKAFERELRLKGK